MSLTSISQTECSVQSFEEKRPGRRRQGFFAVSGRSKTQHVLAVLVVVFSSVCLTAAAAAGWRPLWRHVEIVRARKALQSRDFAEAASVFESLHENLPPTAETLYLQGCALRRLGKLLPADACFTMALDLGWNREAVRRQRLFSAAQRGDIRIVEPQLLRLMDSALGDEVAEQCYEAMAEGYVSCMRPGQAAECISYWKDWQPTNPQPWYWEAVVHEGGEAWQDALASYTRACNADSTHLPALLGRARMELETAQVDLAEPHFRECLQQSPDNPEAFLGLAACYVNRGSRQAAMGLLREALSLDLEPHQAAAALSELGQLQLEDGDVAAAAWLLAKAVEFDPISPRSRLVLATALEQLGKSGPAEEQRKAGHLLSEQQVSMTNIARRVRVNPDNADVRAEAGDMFFKLGMDRDAARWFNTALQIDRNHQASRRGLAKIAARQGNRAEEARHRSFLDGQKHQMPTVESEGVEGLLQ
jgi:tetratricopeptide (TPR) repeat protein